MLRIEVSPGELLDKISILEIKQARISDDGKLRNVRHELSVLARARDAHVPYSTEVGELAIKLKHVNETLWDVEDALRRHERNGDFGRAFVALARKVYVTNDERAAIKRRINEVLDSAIVEEKDYVEYG